MKWKNLLIAFGAGILAGYFLQNNVKRHMLPSEKALSLVKKAFKEKGTINGSWIYTVPQDYEKNGIAYKVYQAGINLVNNDIQEQFEVIVDSTTGTILDVMKA